LLCSVLFHVMTAGLGFYIQRLLNLMAQSIPSPPIQIAICSILSIFLFLEILEIGLRIGPILLSVTRHPVSYRYLSVDPVLQQSLKPYQIIFGDSKGGSQFK